MKSKKYNTVGRVPRSNRKTAERGKMDDPITHIHDRSCSWLGTSTSIKRGGAKLVSWS